MHTRSDGNRNGENGNPSVLDSSVKALVTEELSRVAAHLMFWAVPALLLAGGLRFGWINDQTQVPKALISELKRPLEEGAIWWALSLSFISFLLAVIVGWSRISRFLAEELAGVFYLAGSFSLMLTLAIDLGHWAWTIPPVQPSALYIGAIAVGMMVETCGEALVRKRAERTWWGKRR